MSSAASAKHRSLVWLFDLDNTLHDASHAVFGQLNASMTGYIEHHLGLDKPAAEHLRAHYWRRYGATLLGLVRHHGICPHHFLHDTHVLPDLEARVRLPWQDRQALARLPGKKLILTNAPRAYALRVLRQLKLQQHFDGVIAIEDMQAFGHWRPKPDARMLRMLLHKHGIAANRCVLVDDSPDNLKSARRVGLRTAWMQGYTRNARRGTGARAEVGIHLHGRPQWACARITRLHTLHAWCASSF